MTVSSSNLFSMVTFFLSFWIVPSLFAYTQPASESRRLPALVVVDRIYLAAGVTDKDEEATIGDPGEKAGISDPDEESTIGDPGEKSKF